MSATFPGRTLRTPDSPRRLSALDSGAAPGPVIAAFTQSTIYPQPGTAATVSNMSDNDISTFTGCNAGFAWIKAQLTALTYVNTITVRAATRDYPGGWDATYLNGAAVEWSTDGSTWTQTATVSGLVDGGSGTFAVGHNATYIRISISNYLAVTEFTLA